MDAAPRVDRRWAAARGREQPRSVSGAEALMSSARVPWKRSPPRETIPSTVATRSISPSRWEETMTVTPSDANDLRSRRISSIPAGSRPFVGSSRMSSEGLRANAMAIPRRCFMPREYSRTRLSICPPRRTVSTASLT